MYFASRYRLPEVPKTNAEIEVGGGYLLGEGRYRVAWKLQDETGRVCRKEWNVEAQRSQGDGKVKVGLPPLRWTASRVGRWRPPQQRRRAADPAHDPDARGPQHPRRTRMTARDRVLLLGTLSSLLDRLPTRSVRLVVFNLEQQRELFARTNSPRRGSAMWRSRSTASNSDWWTITCCRIARGHVDLLADLVRQEVNAPQPSDVVLFLGPMARYLEKMPDSLIEKPPTGNPRFFYFQYRPFMRMEATPGRDPLRRLEAQGQDC